MKIKESGRFDLVSLGEVMLRLDPGNTRVRTSRSFNVWEGGGEYNVARGLRKCFGKKTSILTALADNEVGRLIEDLIMQGGVNTDHLIWREYDGVGRSVRNGLNFTERGFGVRGAVGVSDRGRTAVSQLTSKDFDWEKIFEKEGSRWLHTGGIFAALSESAAEVALEAVRTARKSGAKVSYDLNYRPSLWKSIGGKEKAQEVMKTNRLALHSRYGERNKRISDHNEKTFEVKRFEERERWSDCLFNGAPVVISFRLAMSSPRFKGARRFAKEKRAQRS